MNTMLLHIGASRRVKDGDFACLHDLTAYLEQKLHEIITVLKELPVPGGLVSNAYRQAAGEYSFDVSALRSALSKEYPYEEFS